MRDNTEIRVAFGFGSGPLPHDPDALGRLVTDRLAALRFHGARPHPPPPGDRLRRVMMQNASLAGHMGGAVLLLDLATVAPAERVAAFHHTLTDDSVPNHVVHEDGGASIHARMELWQVGGLPLFSTRNSGFTVHRTNLHVRRHRSNPVVSVALQPRGLGRAELAGQRQVFGPDDICVFHELTPRSFGWSGDGASQSLMLDAERLGVPVDTVLRAGFQLRASPLYDLVLNHLRGLWRDPGRLEGDPGAPALANATVELVRALLLSAGAGERAPETRQAMDDTLASRVLAHARRHLTDRDLTPERLAAEHAVSVRQLYAVLSREGISLEQWLITERLALARRMLASARYTGLTVAAVAARCGFAGASHFSRRFQAAYGLTPSEWRRSHLPG
ncbi:helix-turn-helix domain-containing protein [Streptomyces sp. NPDC093093]|uniref:AraC-like ligand-binding domain-containing protein n=1 Tax=Streptomyces sp. NPDC093093 TaxID=3366025 RepID=UPI003803A34C